MSNEAIWYVVLNGQQSGPYNEDQVYSMVQSGDVQADTFTWCEGFTDWVPLSQAEGVSHVLYANPSAPATAEDPYAAGGAGALGGADDDGEATRVVGIDAFRAEMDRREAMEQQQAAEAQQPDMGALAPMPGGPQIENNLEDATMVAFSPAAQDAIAASGVDMGAGYYGAVDPAPANSMGGYEDAPAPDPMAGYEAAPVAVDSMAGYEAAPAADPMGGYEAAPASAAADFGGLSALSPSGPAPEPIEVVEKKPQPNILNPGPSTSKRSDMVGARNENSVLFSLSSLQASTPSAESTTPENNTSAGGDASGLIDIHALASSNAAIVGGRAQNAASSGPDFPSASVAPAPMGVPMMPMGSRKSNAPLIIAIVVGLLVLIGIGATLFVVLNKEDTPPPAPTEKIVERVIVKEVAVKDDKKDDEEAKKNDEKKEEAVAAKEDEEKTGDDVKDDEKKDEAAAVAAKEESEEERKAREAREKEEAEKRAAALKEHEEKMKDPVYAKKYREKQERLREEREKRAQERKEALAAKKKNATKKGGNDSIDDIIGNLDGSKKTAKGSDTKKEATAPAAVAKTNLSKSEVQGVVRRSHGKVRSCYNSQSGEKLSGNMTVRFTIQPSGGVGGVQVTTGKFQGKPVAGCVTRVVRGMRFPKFQGKPLTINYPFILR